MISTSTSQGTFTTLCVKDRSRDDQKGQTPDEPFSNLVLSSRVQSQFDSVHGPSRQMEKPVVRNSGHGRTIDLIEPLQQAHSDVSRLCERELLAQADSIFMFRTPYSERGDKLE